MSFFFTSITELSVDMDRFDFSGLFSFIFINTCDLSMAERSALPCQRVLPNIFFIFSQKLFSIPDSKINQTISQTCFPTYF